MIALLGISVFADIYLFVMMKRWKNVYKDWRDVAEMWEDCSNDWQRTAERAVVEINERGKRQEEWSRARADMLDKEIEEEKKCNVSAE